ncbi:MULTISPECIES: hypothetical protein [Moorena]|uniref:Uncharacterized protein n=1 Tax=Moorena producens 3L TaxID=489825 RepID=F4XQG6_9CYAN|nr:MULTISPECIES: hypothetical protein [Moorena]EGJ33173.1 hypothetical protein LYNGBM3L_48710 [Moorena producens 3L]NEP67228.1 hypothetical protein [Moorena sp. SIO3A5]OLT56285.1 hypothetical protein BI334_32330 [Moorena producens 3L]
MKIAESLDMKGRLTIQKYNSQAQLVDEVKADNSIVYTGRELVAKLFTNQKIDPIRYIAVGTGNTAVKPANDTQLGQEVFRKQIKNFDPSKDLIETGEDDGKKCQIRLSVDLDFGEPKSQPVALTEAGLFNSLEKGKGIMYNRVTFPPITKSENFKLTLVWEILF